MYKRQLLYILAHLDFPLGRFFIITFIVVSCHFLSFSLSLSFSVNIEEIKKEERKKGKGRKKKKKGVTLRLIARKEVSTEIPVPSISIFR